MYQQPLCRKHTMETKHYVRHGNKLNISNTTSTLCSKTGFVYWLRFWLSKKPVCLTRVVHLLKSLIPNKVTAGEN